MDKKDHLHFGSLKQELKVLCLLGTAVEITTHEMKFCIFFPRPHHDDFEGQTHTHMEANYPTFCPVHMRDHVCKCMMNQGQRILKDRSKKSQYNFLGGASEMQCENNEA